MLASSREYWKRASSKRECFLPSQTSHPDFTEILLPVIKTTTQITSHEAQVGPNAPPLSSPDKYKGGHKTLTIRAQGDGSGEDPDCHVSCSVASDTAVQPFPWWDVDLGLVSTRRVQKASPIHIKWSKQSAAGQAAATPDTTPTTEHPTWTMAFASSLRV